MIELFFHKPVSLHSLSTMAARGGPYGGKGMVNGGKGKGKGKDRKGKDADQGSDGHFNAHHHQGAGLWNNVIANDVPLHAANAEIFTYLQDMLSQLEEIERSLDFLLQTVQLRIQQQRFALHVLRGD